MTNPAHDEVDFEHADNCPCHINDINTGCGRCPEFCPQCTCNLPKPTASPEPRPTIEFLCKDDPEANGRKPQIGEQRYTLTFPLEDGRILKVHEGREGMNRFTAMLSQMMVDDANGLPDGVSTPMHEPSPVKAGEGTFEEWFKKEGLYAFVEPLCRNAWNASRAALPALTPEPPTLCRRCGGKGVIESYETSPGGHRMNVSDDCPVCGSSALPLTPEPPTSGICR